ncbi:MAG: TlpA disulfide reductase family protein [Gammaproteobacteria bacterium]
MKHVQATGLVIAILIAAAAAGFGVYEWLQPAGMPPASPAAMSAVHAPAPPLSAAQAMNLPLDDLDDNTHKLADWHGKVLLVNFWATWCPPCREEIPLLVKLQAQYAAQGLQIVGIATDEQSEEGVRKFVHTLVVNYPILISHNQTPQIIAAFGGNFIGLPYTILLDRQDRVLKIHPGELQPHEAESLVRMALHLPAPAPTSATATPVAVTQAK